MGGSWKDLIRFAKRTLGFEKADEWAGEDDSSAVDAFDEEASAPSRPSCTVCGNTFSASDLWEGVCPNCAIAAENESAPPKSALEEDLCPLCDEWTVLESNGLCGTCNAATEEISEAVEDESSTQTENLYSYSDYARGDDGHKKLPKNLDVDRLFQKYGITSFDSEKGFSGPTSYQPVEKWTSAGGVVLDGLSGDQLDYVYVVKPSNNYGPWTFPKGRVDKGETKEQTAVREVWEESGIKSKHLPNGYLGVFEGTMSKTHFYLMVKVGGSPLLHGKESEEVRAVTLEEAEALFKKSGNRRDGAVIAKAREAIDKLKAGMKGKKKNK